MSEAFEIGPGDFLLFTAPSPGHPLRNPFHMDLVYLMGGERRELELVGYPRLRKWAIFEKGGDACIIDTGSAEPFRNRAKLPPAS